MTKKERPPKRHPRYPRATAPIDPKEIPEGWSRLEPGIVHEFVIRPQPKTRTPTGQPELPPEETP